MGTVPYVFQGQTVHPLRFVRAIGQRFRYCHGRHGRSLVVPESGKIDRR